MFLHVSPQGKDGLENPDWALTRSLKRLASLERLKASLKGLGLYFDSQKHISLNVWLRLLEGVTNTVFLVWKRKENLDRSLQVLNLIA